MAAIQPNQSPPDLPATGFIRAKQLRAFVPFGTTTLWGRVKKGTFPKPIKLSAGMTAWRCEDVRAWIADQGKGAQQ
ncbi:MAG: AlpA family phage regulatory protein [Inhella sp.]